jgi:hypothetical protein
VAGAVVAAVTSPVVFSSYHTLLALLLHLVGPVGRQDGQELDERLLVHDFLDGFIGIL